MGTGEGNPLIIAIDVLLAARDAELDGRLRKTKEASERGQLLNEYCDIFFRNHPYERNNWPASEAQKKHRDFLRSHCNDATLDSIARHVEELQLSPDPDSTPPAPPYSVASYKERTAYK